MEYYGDGDYAYEQSIDQQLELETTTHNAYYDNETTFLYFDAPTTTEEPEWHENSTSSLIDADYIQISDQLDDSDMSSTMVSLISDDLPVTLPPMKPWWPTPFIRPTTTEMTFIFNDEEEFFFSRVPFLVADFFTNTLALVISALIVIGISQTKLSTPMVGYHRMILILSTACLLASCAVETSFIFEVRSTFFSITHPSKK